MISGISLLMLATTSVAPTHTFECEFFRPSGERFSYELAINVIERDSAGNETFGVVTIEDESGLIASATELFGGPDVHGAFRLSLYDGNPGEPISQVDPTTVVTIEAKGSAVARPASAQRILLDRSGIGSEIVVVETIAVGFCTEAEVTQ